MIIEQNNGHNKYVKFEKYEFERSYVEKYSFKISDYPQTIDNVLVIKEFKGLQGKCYHGSTEKNYYSRASVPEFLKWINGLKGKYKINILYESEEEMIEIINALRDYKENIIIDIDKIINPNNNIKMIEMK